MYRTVLEIVVLSEDPIPNESDVADVIREADNGDYVMQVGRWDSERISDERMREELRRAGSEPEFFFPPD